MTTTQTQAIEPELKPCPFCGSEAKLLWVDSNRKKAWYVECSNETCCSKPGYMRRDTAEAIATWNKRAAIEADRNKREEVMTDEQIMEHWYASTGKYDVLVPAAICEFVRSLPAAEKKEG